MKNIKFKDIKSFFGKYFSFILIIFFTLIILIGNTQNNGYVGLGTIDYISLIIILTLSIIIMITKKRIVKRNLLLVLLFYGCLSFVFINFSHIYYLGFRGDETRIYIFTIINFLLVILFLFKRKLKLIVMIGLILSFILCLPTGIYIIHRLFTYNNLIFGQDGSVTFSYFFELVVIGFAIKNLKYSFYISAGTMLKSFKQNKIEEEMYIKKKRLLLDIIQ